MMAQAPLVNLTRKALFGFAQLIVGLGVLLFAPAWALDFWQAWVYLLVFAASAALITGYLWKNDPRLLERRANAGPKAEPEPRQQRIQLVASIVFIGIFVLASLDHRFGWSNVPLALVIGGDLLVALGFLVVFVVFRENTFTAATIEVAADQRVVSTGPYALVRHPMYAGALVMLLGTPLALGSWWALLLWIPMALVIVWRLLEEERLLTASLPGYRAYRRQVRFHLIPGIW